MEQSPYSVWAIKELELRRSARCLRSIVTFISTNPNARGKQLLDALEQHYLSRKQRRFAKVPKPFQIPLAAKPKKLDRVLRNVNRYVNRAKKIVLNVANGEFPSKY